MPNIALTPSSTDVPGSSATASSPVKRSSASTACGAMPGVLASKASTSSTLAEGFTRSRISSGTYSASSGITNARTPASSPSSITSAGSSDTPSSAETPSSRGSSSGRPTSSDWLVFFASISADGLASSEVDACVPVSRSPLSASSEPVAPATVPAASGARLTSPAGASSPSRSEPSSSMRSAVVGSLSTARLPAESCSRCVTPRSLDFGEGSTSEGSASEGSSPGVDFAAEATSLDGPDGAVLWTAGTRIDTTNVITRQAMTTATATKGLLDCFFMSASLQHVQSCTEKVIPVGSRLHYLTDAIPISRGRVTLLGNHLFLKESAVGPGAAWSLGTSTI